MLADATRAREAALVDADLLVQEAQDIAERLVVEARERSDGIVSQARAEADRVLQGLDDERERARREARAGALLEVAELRSRAERLVSDIEASLGGLATVLVDAGAMVEGVGSAADELATVAGGLAALDGTTAPVVPDPAPAPPAVPEGVSDAPANDAPGDDSDDGPAHLPSYDCAVDELPDRGFGSADDELADPLPAGLVRERSVAVSARVAPPARLPSTAVAGVAGVAASPGPLRVQTADVLGDDEDLDARPLGWLFRGN